MLAMTTSTGNISWLPIIKSNEVRLILTKFYETFFPYLFSKTYSFIDLLVNNDYCIINLRLYFYLFFVLFTCLSLGTK